MSSIANLHIILKLFFTLLFVSETQSIECHTCSYVYPDSITLPLTVDSLELLTPSKCKTDVTIKNNSVVCGFQIWIESDYYHGQSPSTAVTWTNKLHLDLIGFNTSPSVRSEERIELQIASRKLDHRSIRMDYIYYFCSIDKCNTLENMKRVLNATMIDFDFDRIMKLLAANQTIAVNESITYDSYTKNSGSTFIEPFCLPCHVPGNHSNSSISTCVKAEARTCADYMCGACYWAVPLETTVWAEFEHRKIYWIKNRNVTFSFWYTCTLPNCNSEKKQEEVQSLYTMDFDMNKFAGEVVTSTTIKPNNTANFSLYNEIGMIVSLSLCFFFVYARKY